MCDTTAEGKLASFLDSCIVRLRKEQSDHLNPSPSRLSLCIGKWKSDTWRRSSGAGRRLTGKGFSTGLAMVSPGVPCFCVVSDVLIGCVPIARCWHRLPCWYHGILFQWFQILFCYSLVHAFIELRHTQAMFALPCCLQLVMSGHPALNQGKVIMLPWHTPLQQRRQTVSWAALARVYH